MPKPLQHSRPVPRVTGVAYVTIHEATGPGAAEVMHASFDDFVRSHQASLVRYAFLLSGSDAHAEDLVQDVLTRIFQRWPTLATSEGNLLAYVWRAVTNEYLSWRRRWSTRHIHVVDEEVLRRVPADQPSADPDETLWLSLLTLPRQQRAAVVLRYYEGLSDAEIADVLECRPGTVRGHISRGLATLRATATMPSSPRAGR
jgi:RNA polymerase sigma-70 factor (sigma-E family)